VRGPQPGQRGGHINIYNHSSRQENSYLECEYERKNKGIEIAGNLKFGRSVYQTTRRNILQENRLQTRSRQNLKSRRTDSFLYK
jgi:hypothetical protein